MRSRRIQHRRQKSTFAGFIEAPGAVEEGMLRSWGVTREGEQRDNVIFSILRQEWPESRQRLLSRLTEAGSTKESRERSFTPSDSGKG
jgi:hypothetical protein